MSVPSRIRAPPAYNLPVIIFENHPHPDEILTYADLVVKGTKLARALEKLGLRQGERFCIVMRNHPETIMCMFAASVLGAVLVPIDPRSEEEKLIFQIQNSGAKGVIYSAEFAQSSGNQIFAASEAPQHIVVRP